MLEFLQSHGIAVAVLVFTVISVLLNAVAQFLALAGKSVPGWLGSVISGLGTVVHFLNGNAPAAVEATKAA